MRKVIVKDYNPNWIGFFKEEANSLHSIFQHVLLDIHHIGSTSIPGLSAKPIIDLMPIVSDIQLVDHFNKEMKNLGYEAMGENGIIGRRYFQKGGDNRTHHVHIYAECHQAFGIPGLFNPTSRRG